MESKKIDILEAAKWMVRIASDKGELNFYQQTVLADFAHEMGISISQLIFKLRREFSKETEIFFQADRTIQNAQYQFELNVAQLFHSAPHMFKLICWKTENYTKKDYDESLLQATMHIEILTEEFTQDFFLQCIYVTNILEADVLIRRRANKDTHYAIQQGKELFYILTINKIPENTDTIYVIPTRMIRSDSPISYDRFMHCRCTFTPDTLHQYIAHYYKKRVYKTI